MQPIPDLELTLSIEDQLEQIERLAAAIRALPEYSAYFAANELCTPIRAPTAGTTSCPCGCMRPASTISP